MNPYAAPQVLETASELTTGQLPLASRGKRLGASMLDSLVVAPAIMGVEFFIALASPEAKTESLSTLFMTSLNGAHTYPVELLLIVANFAMTVGINWHSLGNGQTVAKSLLRIQVQTQDNRVMPRKHNIVWRMLPLTLVTSVLEFTDMTSIVLLVSGLMFLDALCIYRQEKNTLHDDLAGSKVVQLPRREVLQ